MNQTRKAVVLLLPFGALMALLVVGCAQVMIQSFGWVPAFSLRQWTLDYYQTVLQDESFVASFWLSFRIAALSSLGSMLVGTVLCAALTKAGGMEQAMTYLVRLPILVPHAVVALFVIQLLSQTGLVARVGYAFGLLEDSSQFPQFLYTGEGNGVVLAYLWKEIPFVAYFTLALMGSIRQGLGQAAENLGASPLKSFWFVTLPLSLPAILRSGLILFLFAFGGYELPMLLGATLPKALPVQAYLEYLSPELRDRPYAMAMYGVILVLSLVLAGGYALLMQKTLKRLGGDADGQ